MTTATPPAVRVRADDEPTARSAPQAGGRRTRRSGLPHALIAPSIAVLALALGYPLVRQVVLSFQEFGLAQQFGQPAAWVGWRNYGELVSDPYLWIVVLRSVAFCLANATITMTLGMAIALLMRQVSKPVRILVQSGLLLAWAMPVLAVLTVWQWMFDAQYGVINWVLVRLGIDYAGHSWLLNPMSFFFVATVVVVWMSIPFVAFTLYAGLTQVLDDTLEAAELDGADGWQRFRHVMVPTIRPILLLVGLLQVIWGLRVFTQIFVLQQAGGIAAETNLLGTYVYRLGIAEGRFGMAAAVAMFMLALMVLMTAGYIRAMVRQEES